MTNSYDASTTNEEPCPPLAEVHAAPQGQTPPSRSGLLRDLGDLNYQATMHHLAIARINVEANVIVKAIGELDKAQST